jgi:hypothetical protein
MLESIPGEIISKAATMLPDAETAPDEAHNVEIRYGRRGRVRITFRRFMYTRGNTSRWCWTATGAARLRDKITERDKTLAEYFRDWQPTPEAVNALPKPLRRYIHRLETTADSAGLLRENSAPKDRLAALSKKLADG